MIFLIEYNRKKGKVLKFQTYLDSERQAAENARLEMEISLVHSGIGYEVVLLDAKSENDLHKTHNRYFATPQEIAGTAGTAGTK